MLEVKPEKCSPAPRYPTREAALQDPELLKRLPLRWRACRQAAVAAGLGLSMAVLAGCETPATPRNTPVTTAAPTLTPTPEDTSIYPGEVMPPPLMNEADALVKIKDILKSYDVDAADKYDEKLLPKPVVYLSNESNEGNGGYQAAQNVWGDGRVDLYDASAGIGVEYLGSGDNWEGLTGDKAVKPQKGEPYVLVMREFDETTDESAIRQQIKDFLNWLKADGIGE